MPVAVALDYASAPRITRGINWQRSERHLHLSFDVPKPTAAASLTAAGGVMLLGLGLIAVLTCSGMVSIAPYDGSIGLATFIGTIALALPAISYFVFRYSQRRSPTPPPVELDATSDGLSLLIPAQNPAPLVWPANRIREIRCNAAPGRFCIEVFPAETLPEEHWFEIAGELALEILEIELRRILRLGEAAVPANPPATLSYARPVLPVKQQAAMIPWIGRSDYVLVMLPPTGAELWHQIIMSLALLGGIGAFLYVLMLVLDLDQPAIPVIGLFAGTTLIGFVAAIVIGRRSQTRPEERDRSSLVMGCPGKLQLHVRGSGTGPESFDATRIKSLTITPDRRGLRLHLKMDDGGKIDRLLPTRALGAGAALCDDLRRILRIPEGRGY